MEYHFLGLSPATAGMLIEAIIGADDTRISINIWQNVDKTSDIEFSSPKVKVVLNPVGAELPPALTRCVLGVYQPGTKKAVHEQFKDQIDDLSFISVIHRDSSPASTAIFGEGVFINPQVTLAPFCRLEDFVTVNRNSSIGHHTVVGAYTTVNPGAHIAGHCKIGCGAVIGMGALVVDGVSIGDDSIIGAGSVVTRDIPAGVKAFGAPCKVIESR